MILTAKHLELNESLKLSEIHSTKWFQLMCQLALDPGSWESMNRPDTADEQSE